MKIVHNFELNKSLPNIKGNDSLQPADFLDLICCLARTTRVPCDVLLTQDGNGPRNPRPRGFLPY